MTSNILPCRSYSSHKHIPQATDGVIRELNEEAFSQTTNEVLGDHFFIMSFGISVAPEEFQRRLYDNLSGILGIKPIHDDVQIYRYWMQWIKRLKRVLILNFQPKCRDV